VIRKAFTTRYFGSLAELTSNVGQFAGGVRSYLKPRPFIQKLPRIIRETVVRERFRQWDCQWARRGREYRHKPISGHEACHGPPNSVSSASPRSGPWLAGCGG